MTISIREVVSRARRQAAQVWLKPWRILAAAAVFHLTFTIAIYAVGRHGGLPGTFDSNGIGISFAVDGIIHRADAEALSELLSRGEVLNWLTASYPLHDKLYSICFALFGPWLGLNIVSVEPLNLLYYLGILVLVYKLGEEVFSKHVGRVAAVAVALWPSFLLHTTQFLKDPLFILGMLAFVLIVLRFLTRNYGWLGALSAGAGGGLIAAALWLARDSMWEIAVVILLLGAALLVAEQFRKGSVQFTNLVGMALMIAAVMSAQQFLPKIRRPSPKPTYSKDAVTQEGVHSGTVSAAEPTSNNPPDSTPSWLVRRVSTARGRSIARYPDAGSNLDHSVPLNSTKDIIRYLPRAAVIGFFAPFPNIWFAAGKEVGSTGRLLAGLENVVIYLFEALALFALWHRRRKLPVWLLFGAAATGMIALGLVVINVGALFRLRYAFVILVIILGADGAAQIFDRRWKNSTEAKEISN